MSFDSISLAQNQPDGLERVVTGGRSKRPFLRFIVVGGLSTVINYAVFLLCFQILEIFYSVASMIGYLTGLLVGYHLNRAWTFDAVIDKKSREFALYFAVYMVSLLLSICCLRILVALAGIPPTIANVMAIGVSFVSNFIGCRYVVFNRSLKQWLLPRLAELKVTSYFNRYFCCGLVLKLVLMCLISSPLMERWFIPFTDYFIESNFRNPYQHFFELGEYAIFPYSSSC